MSASADSVNVLGQSPGSIISKRNQPPAVFNGTPASTDGYGFHDGENMDVVVRVKAIPSSNGHEREIPVGTPFFTMKKHASHTGHQSAGAFALHGINYLLRKAAEMRAQDLTEQAMQSRKRTSGQRLAQYSAVPKTLAELQAHVQLHGRVWSSVDQDPRTRYKTGTREIDFGIQVQGLARGVPNYWGAVEIGDKLGFVLEWQDATAMGMPAPTDWRGDPEPRANNARNIRVMQIRPVFNRQTGEHYTDGGSWHKGYVDEENDLVYDRYEPTIYMHFGTVKAASTVAPDSMLKEATQTLEGLKNLRKGYHRIDVALHLLPYSCR